MAPHVLADYPLESTATLPVKQLPVTAKVVEVQDEAKSTPAPPAPPQRNWLMGEKAFNGRMPHHDGIKALWETKWKFPCTKSVYPFHDGLYEDFAPIFEHLIAHDINDGTSPEYTSAFFPMTTSLEEAGDRAMEAGETSKASDIYLRAACVLRIARFPYISAHCSQTEDPTKWRAWEWQKRIYMKAGSHWSPSPVVEVDIPFTTRLPNDLDDTIPAYIRLPPTASPPPSPSLLWSLESKEEEQTAQLKTLKQTLRRKTTQCPVVILLTGLDGYRPDNTVRTNEFLARGWAAVVLEIPGTADCPADPSDPLAPERLWDSLFAYLAADGRFDMSRVLCWGLSAGGYYAIRIAHTHKDKLAGVVAQGAGAHYFFDREWIDKAEGHEYPFKLAPAFARKHGYGEGVDGVEEYKVGVQKKFSLLENGVLDREGGSARLLLINGMQDGLMPIEDSMLLFEHGTPKEARFFSGALHMGYPMANSAVYPWMEQVVASVEDKA